MHLTMPSQPIKKYVMVNNMIQMSLSKKIFVTCVVLPTLLTLFYFGIIASPMYISEARFAIRSSETPQAMSGVAALFTNSTTGTGVDANIVLEYIQSPDIMLDIEKELAIFEHYSAQEYDFISRLSSKASLDDQRTFWQKMVTISLDVETGIIALSIKAYTPEMAKKLTDIILVKSEALVNAMSQRAQQDAISLASMEVETAEKRIRNAHIAIRDFRDRSGMLDPVAVATGLQTIVTELEGKTTKVKAEIAEMSTFMSQDAPKLVALHSRLMALESQLSSEKLRLAGETRANNINAFAAEYENLQLESEFARQQLVSAMTSLEAARVKAHAKSRYVVAFQTPLLADESLYPRPFLFALYAFLGALVLVGLCSLIISAVREHTGF